MKHDSVTVAIITVFCELEFALLVVIPTLEPLIVGSDAVEISEEVTGTTFVIIATGFIPDNAVPEFSPVTLLKLTSPFIRLKKRWRSYERRWKNSKRSNSRWNILVNQCIY